jgi:uncharacterized protein YigE (DUF2233 family)
MTKMKPRIKALLALLGVTVLGMGLGTAGSQETGHKGPCRDIAYEGIPYTICEVSLQDDLRLWLDDAAGKPLGTFERVTAALAPQERLVFAMNAGMYHADRGPVGLFVAGGQERHAIVTSEGPGNFGLLPNGVFCAEDAGFRVVESRSFKAAAPACRIATQSGPMLVIDGQLHPRFLPDSDSFNIRNGVGVSGDGQKAWFAISNRAVTFHQFARLFRDHLHTPNALFLDGSISRLAVPALGRQDFGVPMGPIIGVVAPAEAPHD